MRQEPQCILTMPLLEGLTAPRRCRRAKNNYIGITEDANTMFAKVLSISDELMWRWYALLSFRSMADIEALQAEVAAGRNPKDAKVMLARMITARFHFERPRRLNGTSSTAAAGGVPDRDRGQPGRG